MIRHILIRLLRNKILTLNINPENPIDIRTRRLRMFSEILDSRVTDRDIQTTEFLHDRLEHRAYFFLLGDIGFHCDSGYAMRANLLSNGLCSCCG